MKKTQLTIVITALVLFGIVFGVPAYRQETAARQQTSSVADGIEKQPLYTVRAYQNVLAVYKTGESEPWRVTDIRVSSLREYDQRLMEQGFPLYSDEELTVFMEDYGS